MAIQPRALFSCLEEDLARDPSLSRGFEYLDTTAFGESHRLLAASRLRASLLKKFKDTEEPDAENRAFCLWQSYNERCKNYKLELNTSADEELWGEFKSSLHRFFSPEDGFCASWKLILEEARIGPGKTILAKSTDMYSKLFSSSLSSTSSGLHQIYRSDTTSSPSRFTAEETRSATFGYSIVQGSRLAFVPKTREIRRSICVEPNLNIYLQLGLATLILDRLWKKFGISTMVQAEKNRKLAQAGSLDGSFATIDLSSASDSISLGLCEAVLPPTIFGPLLQLRSPYTSYKGSWIELHMVSSMGNGYTFPLQTVLFTCMVEAAYRCADLVLDKPYLLSGNFGVFGDDIVCWTGCPKGQKAHRLLLRLLHLSGFEVNHGKSFFEGDFRESCGRDFYMGRNVRGVFLKTLRTVPGRFVAINRLLEWSAIHGIDIPSTIKLLLGSVPRFYIPPDGPEDGGIRVPWSFARSKLPERRNWAPKYYYLAPVSSFLEFDANERPRALAKKLGLGVNPLGLYLTFLAGHLRDGKIGIRPVSNQTKRRWKVTPNWDNYSLFQDLNNPVGRQQWEATVTEALTGP